MIKIVTFFFEDHNFLPLALYQAKANIYVFRQDYMTDQDYLQRFNNLVYGEKSYNGWLRGQ